MGTQTSSTNSIMVAGGGIGGLASALGLAKVGMRVTLLERSAELGEIGAGIQLAPNAFRAFDYLGVADNVRDVGIFIETLTMMDAMTADRIASVPLDEEFLRRFGNPYAVVHRGELHRCLLRACEAHANIELKTDSEVVDYVQDAGSVTIKLANGRSITGSALVAADGLMSRMRQKVVNDGVPRVTGHTSYRSVIPIELMPEDLRWNRMTIWVGPKCHLVHYPISDWKLFNLVVTAHNDAPEAISGRPVSHEEVARSFTHIHETPLKIIEHGSDWKMWVLCDRDPVTTWRDGRVVLLGDAAHPMRQYLAQGACMALEDAVQLSREVEQSPGHIEQAFEAYRLARIERTARVQVDSRRIGDAIFHAEGDAARRRNEIMRSLSAADYYDYMDWLYGHDVSAIEGRPANTAIEVS